MNLKKLLFIFLILSFTNSFVYAEQDDPFDSDFVILDEEITEITIEEKNSSEDTKKVDLSNYKFPITGTIESNSLRLRNWPWGMVSGKYDKDTKITVLGVSGEFYEVIVLGVKGYMHKNYISIPGVPATLEEPNYPGDTRSGGYLPKEGNSDSTSDSNSSKVDSSDNNNNKEPVVSTNRGISAEEFKSLMSSMATPTRDEIIKLAGSIGLSADYVKILVGTTEREGYVKDTYLHYGWASAMINCPVTIKQMQGWDPGRSGDANYYSQANIDKGYNQASSDVLKAVYLALKYRNKKIVECNGMYKNTPSSYNKLYASSVYNCSIYEKK